MAKDAKIRDEEDEEQGGDEPDHGKPANVATTTTREPSKGILKAPRVTFDQGQDEKRVVALPFKDSIDEDDDEIVPRQLSKKSSYSDRSSMYSLYSLGDGKTGTVAIFAALIVLKIIFVDIWTSLGDAITDFLQGLYLMFDFYNGFAWKADTASYGIIVLLACWVPGIVAVIHILAHYRNEYFGLSKDLDKDFRQSRKKKFCLVVFLCFFFYPFVPTLAYIVNLWHLNGSKNSYNVQTAQLELFARVAHSITGCIEAPFQLIMTSWLIMKGVLDIPWRTTLVDKGGFTDRFENQIPAFSIPMWTLCFSIIDIIGCSIQINIFNVYIGQLRNFKCAKKYFNLVGGHFPFFFHAVCFRIITFTFLMIYLDTMAGIPLFLIWLSNIIIGYATVGKHKIPKEIRPKLKRMQSVARQNANLPKISSNVQRKKNNENTPVWLNSFLSIFVPSCFVHTADPALLQYTEGLTEDEKEKHEEVKKKFFEYEKKFQRKVIRLQVQTSTTFLMISLAIVFILVNFTGFQYNNNIFSNDEFNVLCCTILGLGIISYLFLFEIDVFDLLHLNDKPGEGGVITIKYKEKRKEDLGEDVPDGVNLNIELPDGVDEVEYEEKPHTTKKHGPFKKTMISILFTLLAVSPIIAGFTYSSLGINSPAYLVMKTESGDYQINIQMIKSRLLNNPSSEAKEDAEGILVSFNNNQKVNTCKYQPVGDRNEILLVDMDEDNFKDLSDMHDISCLPFKGIILMENVDNRASRPIKFNAAGSPVTKFPIITISYRDANKTRNDMQDGSFVNIIFDDFDNLLERAQSDIYLKECPENGCTSMGYPKLQDPNMYIGCDGEAKLRAKVKMTCTSSGRRCPELETWKKRIEKGKIEKFEKCFGTQDDEDKIVFPPVQCIKADEGKVRLPKACPGEEEFWSGDGHGHNEVCWNPTTQTVKLWKKECRREEQCTLNEWGSWSNWKIPGVCTSRTKKQRFRFCRKRADCVLIEIDKKYGNSMDDNCDWTDPDSSAEYGKTVQNCTKT